MEVIKLAGFLVSAGSSYVAFLYRLCWIRRGRHDVVYRALIVTLALQCMTFTMGAVALASPVLLGVRNLGILFLHLSAVALCVSARIVLLLWAEPLAKVRDRIRYWIVTGIALGAVLAVLFFAGGAPRLPEAALDVGSDNPVIEIYLLVFIVSQAVPCALIYRQCLPYARIAPNPWLRRSLRLLAAGAAVLLLYCVARTINILSPLLGINIGNWQVVASIASAVGIVLLSLSLTMPSWGAHLSSLRRWVDDCRSYRALYPLWHSLYKAFPAIALEPPSAAVGDMQYRLHRRVIEIHDAWRILRPYMSQLDAVAHSRAAGAGGDEAEQAAIEAMRIKCAIAAMESGRIAAVQPAHGTHGTHGAHGAHGASERDSASFPAEVFWLARVSEAYARLGRG
jgi:hypothetical protein